MATIFSVEEARAFPYFGRLPLESDEDFSDEQIEAAADRITQDFALICGVSFVAVAGAVAELNSDGGASLPLPTERVTSVETIERWDGSAWVADTTTYRLLGNGTLLARDCWPCGVAVLRVTYSHGYDEPPPAIKQAALILAVNQLTDSNVSDRATQATNELGTYNLAVAGWRDQAYYGYPAVDSVLARYSERGPLVG